MQKLHDTYKLFLEDQRSPQRYGFIDTIVSEKRITVHIDIDVKYSFYLLYNTQCLLYYRINIIFHIKFYFFIKNR